MKPRRERPKRALLLAGFLLLAILATAYAAHEAEPVLNVDGGELEVEPTPALEPEPEQPQQQPQQQQQQQQQPQLIPWGNPKQQKPQQQKQQQQRKQQQKPRQQQQPQEPSTQNHAPAASDAPPAADAAAGGAFPSPSPSPAPKLATILPLMPMVLPGCPMDNILDSNKAWDFPKNWASMSVEQQALHPINLLLMNMVGVPSTDLLSMVNPCLYSWGVVKGSVTKIVKDYKVGNSMTMKTVVLVFRTKKHVWVVFRATDDDWAADFDCMYTSDLRKKLNVPTPPLAAPKLQLHRGFWSAYLAVDKQLMQEVNKQLKLVKTSGFFGKPQVWLAGHSLGGALATIAAFRMAYDPWFNGEVAGVVTYGSPRVGNEVWQTLYQEKLMDKTLRWNNHRDLFAALPAKGQFCLSSSPLKTVFSFRHVGKAVLLCPSAEQPGLQEFRFFPKGTETSCHTGETLIIGTHLLGHYFDGWRRAYAHKNGLAAATVLSGGPHVRSVMCGQCALAVKPYPLPDNKAARNDGVVSCVNDKSCNDKELFSVVSWAGLFPTAFFRSDAVCDGPTALCQVPSAALTQVQNKLMEIAPNITAAVGALASKAFQNNPMAQFFSGMAGINMTSFMAAYNGNATATGGIGQGQHDKPHGEDASGEEPEPDGDSSEPTPAKTAATAKVSVSEFAQADLVVEPSLDGDILVVTADGQGSSSSNSSGSDAAAAAGANSTAAASAGHSKPHAQHGAGHSNDADAAAEAADSDASSDADATAEANGSDASSEGSSSAEPSVDQAEEDEGSDAKPAVSRPKVLDVLGGFVGGFWSHLTARQQ